MSDLTKPQPNYLRILDLAANVWPSFAWAKHHRFVADQLEAVGRGEEDRLIIAQPPQTSKSTLASQTFPAWYLLNFPKRNIILLSYEASLAETHSAKAREIVREWGWLTGVELGLRQANGHWQTKDGGQLVAGSIMGGVTGKPASIVLIDDPLKGDEAANSPIVRDKLIREYMAVCETRLAPGGAVVLMQTRWHPHDLCGQLLQLQEQGGKKWKHIKIPAIAEEQDILGREVGESIWPERYPVEHYEQVKKQLELLGQTYQFASLYQQDPTGGNKVVEWPSDHFGPFMWFDDSTRPLTKVKIRIQSLDPSKGTNSKNGDFQAHIVMDVMEDNTILVESWLLRQTQEQMLDHMLDLWQEHRANAVIIEAGQGQHLLGPVALQMAKIQKIDPPPLYCIENTLNKDVRIRMGLSPLLAQHRLKFKKTTSNQILVGQLKEFPTGRHDDGPDALELALQMANKLLYGKAPPKPLVLSI